jgi:hypothetical protein
MLVVEHLVDDKIHRSGGPEMSRQMWQLLEPVHAVVYYAPEVNAELRALGYDLTTRWPSYFPLRSAPLGAAGPKLVTAAFYSFNPAMVAEHVPAAWSIATPADVLAARLRGMDGALRALLGDRIDSPEMTEAADLAERVADAADTAGRPLAAAVADLPRPQAPHLRLWHAATLLREHRGDGHVVALQAAGLDPVESLVSHAAVGAAPASVFGSRQWTDEQWAAAVDRLRGRGLVEADGTATEVGRDLRRAVEQQTDDLAAAPWGAIGPQAGRLAQLIGPMMQTVVESGLLPMQSTLGLMHQL